MLSFSRTFWSDVMCDRQLVDHWVKRRCNELNYVLAQSLIGQTLSSGGLLKRLLCTLVTHRRGPEALCLGPTLQYRWDLWNSTQWSCSTLSIHLALKPGKTCKMSITLSPTEVFIPKLHKDHITQSAQRPFSFRHTGLPLFRNGVNKTFFHSVGYSCRTWLLCYLPCYSRCIKGIFQ